MNPTDFWTISYWWLVFLVLSSTMLPVTRLLFPKFVDKGYIFGKMLGMAALSYLMMVLSEAHILPFTQLSVFICLLILIAGVYGSILYRSTEPPGKVLSSLFKTSIKVIILEEVIFFIALWSWAVIRGFAPDIHGLEKYMDFGFVNSILRATYFPPKDMWFPPKTINYYYFGHLVTAVLTKLSDIPSNYTFNLMLATMFALCFNAAFSLGMSFTRPILSRKGFFADLKIFFAGLLSAFLVSLAGNLHIIYAFFKAYPNDTPVPPWQLPFQPFLFPNAYWYPNATRFIPFTIHEFPIYSWVVADLHGHVLDIPFVMLTIALLFSLWQQQERFLKPLKKLSGKTTAARLTYLKTTLPIPLPLLILLGSLLAIMYMTNAWDGLIYLLLTAAVLGVFVWQRPGEEKNLSTWNSLIKRLPTWLFSLAIVGISYIIIALPFSLFFEPLAIVKGIGVLCAPTALTNIGKIGPFLFEANHCQHSPWWQLLILYGVFFFFIISFAVFLWKTTARFLHDEYIVLLIMLSLLLIIVPEFVYAKDIYPEHYRANTMFKLVFQSFIMLSLSSSYIIVRLLTAVRGKFTKMSWITRGGTVFWTLVTVLLVCLVSIYPYMAITSYYNNLQKYQGLDGTAYLKTLYPEDYAGIQWLNSHVKGQPVILEAQGDSYTDYERISTDTGLPTVLGWTVHEWLWRGSYDVPAPRIAEVQTMYTSPDLQVTKQLLDKYHVQYVYIGGLERQKYPNLLENKFKQLGHPVFHTDQTTIYQITQ